MKAVVQRVSEARVTVGERVTGHIDTGLLVLLGVERKDTPAEARYLAEKIVHLRIFADQADKMNLAVKEVGGKILAVSQFTLLGDCRKGRRPSYAEAAPPDQARALYELFVQEVADRGVGVETGEFQAMMQVALVNDGPVTILLDSHTMRQSSD